MMNLQSIYQNFISHEQKLNDFLTHEFSKTPALPYLSCDLRHSGFKVAVVDTNLFPAGFNNLCKVFTEQTVEEFKHYFKTHHPLCKNLLIFTEAHTRNKFYFENIYRLQEMLNQAGLDVKVATQFEEFTEDQSIVLENDKTLILHAIPQNTSLQLGDGWIPDLILSNNDFSSGIPEILQSTSIPIIPSPLLGWHRRKKSDHFKIYSEIATEIGDLIELDPWLFNSYHSQVDEIDLNNPESLQRMANEVDFLIQKIQKKYDQYQINSQPYVFVKNNAGTYGMGVTYFMNGQEVLNLNRKTRFKLLSSKGGSKVSSFFIQEGIVTADFYSGYPIEPVIYAVGESAIGGFFRINEERDEWSSLNSKGMAFSCLCLHKLDQPHEAAFLNCTEKQTLVKLSFYLTQIAALAAAREGTKI